VIELNGVVAGNGVLGFNDAEVLEDETAAVLLVTGIGRDAVFIRLLTDEIGHAVYIKSQLWSRAGRASTGICEGVLVQ
jgi:hypothetical protein